MDYLESVAYLYSLGNEMRAMKFGLEAIEILSEAMGRPDRRFPVVHIAGTNGKGSTSAMVECIARAAGLRAGLYTSPHLISINERMRIGDQAIPDEDFARIASRVRETAEQLVEKKILPTLPTFFEQVTMIAYRYFAEQQVDLAILEVGMGGRLDATNICAPLVTAITPVGLDHQQYLGETLAEIAWEKAGIIKSGVPVIVAPQPSEAFAVIAARAAELGAPLAAIEQDVKLRSIEILPEAAPGNPREIGCPRIRYRSPVDSYEASIGLPGRHQALNALTAIRIMEALRLGGFSISREAICAGLENVRWPGRLEWIRPAGGGPSILLDGAHNAAGAEVLRDFLRSRVAPRFITMIFGVMADKAVTEMADRLFPLAGALIVARIRNARAAEPVEIARRAGREALCLETAEAALEAAIRLTPADGVICVCGSLFLVGEIKQALWEREEIRNPPD